jgi:diadenosine tetraphosphatase ApaH/serine/threonine PP2A family protein phosphatase
LQPVYGEPKQLNGHRLIVNPGSIGQPRDSNKDAAYGILHVQEAIFEYRRVPYPVKETQEKMRKLDMPERLITRLEHGW